MNPMAICSPPSTPSSPRPLSPPSPPQTTASTTTATTTTTTTTGGFYLKSPSYPSTPAPHYRTNIHSSHYPPQTPPPGYTHPPSAHSHPSNRQQGQRYGHSRSNSSSSIYHSYQYQYSQSHPYSFPSSSMIDPALSPGGLTGLGIDPVNSDRQIVYLDRLDVSELSRALRRARAGMSYQQLEGDDEVAEEGIEEGIEDVLPGYRPRARGAHSSSRSIHLAPFTTTLSHHHHHHPPPSLSDANCSHNPNQTRSVGLISDPSRRPSCLPSIQNGPFFTDGASPIVCPLEEAHRSGEIDPGDGDRDAEEQNARVGVSWVVWGLGVGLGVCSVGWAYASAG